MTIANAFSSTTESIDVVQDVNWEFSAQCNNNPLLHNFCMFVVDLDVYYIVSGANKNISLCSATIAIFLSLPFHVILSHAQIIPLTH